MRSNLLTNIILVALVIALGSPAFAFAGPTTPVNNPIFTNVSTLAGTGMHGAQNGTQAQFNLPAGIFGTGDTIYIADTYNNLIRSITPGGTTSRFAGDILAFDELGFPAGFLRDGYLYQALFNRPTDGIALEDGRILVVDSANHSIRLIDGANTYTFAGGARAGMANGPAESALFNHPSAIALDIHGNLFVADTLNHVIRQISYDGTVTTIAGMPGLAGFRDGYTYEARFHSPMGLAVSADGTQIYVADTGNHLIRVIEDGEVSTLAGNLQFLYTDDNDDRANLATGGFANGDGDSARFNLPKGIALLGDTLIVADYANHKLRTVQPCGETSTLAGTGYPGYINGSTDVAEFHFPSGVFVRGSDVFVADTGNNVIRQVR